VAHEEKSETIVLVNTKSILFSHNSISIYSQ